MLADARVQSLAITLDKVKYLLRQQPTANRATAPLAPLVRSPSSVQCLLR